MNLVMKMRSHPAAYPQSLAYHWEVTSLAMTLNLHWASFAGVGVCVTEGVRIRVRVQVTTP